MKVKFVGNYVILCWAVVGLAIIWWQKQSVANGYSFSTNSTVLDAGFLRVPRLFQEVKELGKSTNFENTYSQSLSSAKSAINPQIVAANTRFSLKLFSHLQTKQANQNLFISPASVSVALAIAYNGSNGETRQAIGRTLELQQISIQDVNEANALLKKHLLESSFKSQLCIANSLWIDRQETIKPDFNQKIKQYYQAEIKSIDFRQNHASVTINDWVKKSTNGKIDTIIERIEPNTTFLLLNAIYFAGSWKYPFAKNLTQDYPFTLANGTQKSVKMMFQQIPGIKYYENELFQAINLPYADNRLSMYIFLPNKSLGLRGFYQNLSHENWQKWMGKFNSNELDNDYSQLISVGLPRFKLEYETDLVDTLKALGMQIAFSQNADFSAMTVPPLWIDKVQHKTFVEVNEEGTTAAAVTTMGGTRGGGMQIIVDRPFFCVIGDNLTGTILFMGSIADPQ
ncbi:serpin family protein [Phormidium sp. LEGE 05292]|uniref:serpin family protein n=1 Tax=[Phormidium] sp. LEGE 05292 TaxID=767427 RepID=UPI001882C09D|nr:serpin family protein [Phormidium sp. LEGE 05292]MBE9228941.1 serpin family protein [Phormidium sp. LEGE 05292]